MKSPLLGRRASLTLLSATPVSWSPDSPTAVATPGDNAARLTSPFNRNVFRIAAAAGDNPVGIAGKRLGLPATVRMVDGSGRPVAGAAVSFAASQGVASSRAAHTDARGNASVIVDAGSGARRAGAGNVDQLIASDLLGNTITLTSAQLRARGYAIDVVVPEIPEF